MTRWKNKKNGKYYALLAHGTDCTNARDGLSVVVYSPEDNPHTICVQEGKEFYQEFEPAGDVEPGQEPWNKKRGWNNMNEKIDRDDFEEETMWWIDCPKCGDPIEITEHPIDMAGVYCEGCKTYFELEN